MRYKVCVSTKYDHEEFCCEREEQAVMLYNMAITSQWFDYVCLYEVNEETLCVREWSPDNG